MNGPGLTAPGVYAAGLHNTASQAATLLTAATAAAAAASFHGEPVESDLSTINGGSSGLPLRQPLHPQHIRQWSRSGSEHRLVFFGEPASGVLPYDAPGYQTTNGSYPVGTNGAASGTLYFGSTTWSWSITGSGGSTSASFVSEYSSDNGGVDIVQSETWDLSSSTIAGTTYFDYGDTFSGTSHSETDQTTTENGTVVDSLVYSSSSESWTYETSGSSSDSGLDNSTSFWGNGDTYTDSGSNVTGNSSTGGTTTSFDSWNQVEAQYSGFNSAESGASPSAGYTLTSDYESGQYTSEDTHSSVAITGGTSQNSSYTWTQHSTNSQVTLSDNEVSGVYDFQDQRRAKRHKPGEHVLQPEHRHLDHGRLERRRNQQRRLDQHGRSGPPDRGFRRPRFFDLRQQYQ